MFYYSRLIHSTVISLLKRVPDPIVSRKYTISLLPLSPSFTETGRNLYLTFIQPSLRVGVTLTTPGT